MIRNKPRTRVTSTRLELGSSVRKLVTSEMTVLDLETTLGLWGGVVGVAGV